MPSPTIPTPPRPSLNKIPNMINRMSLLNNLRYRFHRYRFDDLPQETQEAIIQVEEFETSRQNSNEPVISKGKKGRRYELYESPRYIGDREYLEENGYDLEDLDKVITMLLDGEKLPRRFRVQERKEGLWDCYVNDRILFYRCSDDGLILEAVRIGRH